jgi:hypothetical protein
VRVLGPVRCERGSEASPPALFHPFQGIAHHGIMRPVAGLLESSWPQMPHIAPFPLTGPFPFHMSAIAGWLLCDLTGVADVPVARHTSKWVLSPRTVRLPRPLLFAILPGRVYARRRYVLVEI